MSLSNRVTSAAIALTLTGTLGGCVTGTEISYSEYGYDRSGVTERTYEHNVYSDPVSGIESERCRTIVKRRINAFGDEVVRRDRNCDMPGEAYGGEPWPRQAAPQSVYPSPVEPTLPPADVPDAGVTEIDPG